MCWSKESSFIGFIVNLFFNYLHINKNSRKYIPFLLTITITQLLDFLVYSGYNKKVIGNLLKIDLILQIFFIYYILKVPKIFFILILYSIYKFYNWIPYKNFNICDNKPIDWNEKNKYYYFYLLIVWLLIPFYFSFMNKNYDACYFIIFSYILLHFSSLLNFGSLGKNWCMMGVFVNIFIYINYSI